MKMKTRIAKNWRKNRKLSPVSQRWFDSLPNEQRERLKMERQRLVTERQQRDDLEARNGQRFAQSLQRQAARSNMQFHFHDAKMGTERESSDDSDSMPIIRSDRGRKRRIDDVGSVHGEEGLVCSATNSNSNPSKRRKLNEQDARDNSDIPIIVI